MLGGKKLQQAGSMAAKSSGQAGETNTKQAGVPMARQRAAALVRSLDRRRRTERSLARLSAPVKRTGYTIVEVMIVLAVSGVMFAIAATFINGKQQTTSFTEGVNEMASQLQDVISQVSSGKYSDVSLACTYNPVSNTTTASIGGADNQGQNPNCVFLGKLLYFSYDNTDGTNADYELASLAGGRLDASGNPVTTVAGAGPGVIVGLSSPQATPQNLTVGKMTVDGTGVRHYALGFLQSPAINASGDLASGIEQVGLYYVNGLGPGQDAGGTGSGIAATVNHATVLSATSADICLMSSKTAGIGTRYADLTLGNNTAGGAESSLAVDVTMHGTTRPATCR
jgi:prepilin-type N-terminal cleavage/methylation domain-containing protein